MGEVRKTPRVVLDTNVLVSAFGWKGPEFAVYELCVAGLLQLCTSEALLDELERVLSYRRFGFSVVDRLAFLNDVKAAAVIVEAPTIEAVMLHDPDDDCVLAAAVSGRVDAIVSGDADLLDLQEYQGIPIFGAGEFLARLKPARAGDEAGRGR